MGWTDQLGDRAHLARHQLRQPASSAGSFSSCPWLVSCRWCWLRAAEKQCECVALAVLSGLGLNALAGEVGGGCCLPTKHRRKGRYLYVPSPVPSSSFRTFCAPVKALLTDLSDLRTSSRDHTDMRPRKKMRLLTAFLQDRIPGSLRIYMI